MAAETIFYHPLLQSNELKLAKLQLRNVLPGVVVDWLNTDGNRIVRNWKMWSVSGSNSVDYAARSPECVPLEK